jgi:hypothetical protein
VVRPADTNRSTGERQKRDRGALLAILGGFALLTVSYSFIVPVFNAPDETHHLEYIRHLADHRRLPDQTTVAEATSNEGFNPPLYYALGAALLSLVSPDNAADLVVPDYAELTRFRRRPAAAGQQSFFPPLNPHYVKWGWGREQNMFLRADKDHFPFQGSLRAVHLLRLISIPFGVLTILLVFQTTRALFPGESEIALAAAATCAFNPQFTFLHAYLNNDTLVTTFATICFWLATRLILSKERDKAALVALGLCAGLGLLSKLNFVFMLPIVLLAIWLRPSARGAGVEPRLQDSLLFVVPVLAVAGWYFLRSLSIYGLDDPLGWELRAHQSPELTLAPELRADFFKEVFARRLFTSFWGQFDWLTIWLPTWSYAFYGLLSLMGLVGVGAWARELRTRALFDGRRLCFSLYLASIVLALASLISLNFTFLSAQGRLIFPVIAPICIFMAAGLRSGLASRWPAGCPARDRLALGFIVVLAGLNLFALLGVIAPIYA